MIKISNKKILATTILITILVISSAYSMLLPMPITRLDYCNGKRFGNNKSSSRL